MIARYTGQFIQMQKLLSCKKILEIYVNSRRTGRWSLMLKTVSPSIYDYIMDKEVLQSVLEESDLGVIISSDLKPSKQCVSAVKKANMTLGMIKRHIVSRDKDTIIRLFKGLVRPKLEYCIQSWNPTLVKDIELLVKDIELLEQVQHRATRLIPEISHLPYEERLKYLNLTTLELRRHRRDLI